MKKHVYLVILTVFLSCSQDEKVNEEQQFNYSDIDLFWEVFDKNSSNFSSATFQEQYINKGTAGLKDYAKQKNLAPVLEVVLNMDEYLAYYKSIQQNTRDLSDVIEKSKAGFDKLKVIAPNSKLFNVYFLIGGLTAGGRISENGLLIAVEMFAKTSTTSLEELNEWHQNVIRTKKFLPSIVVHELIHKQQHFSPKNQAYATLLEKSLQEGMADFISNYILTGEPFMNQHLHDFGDEIELSLWNEFNVEKDKNFKDTEWLYTGNNTTKGYPADLGYYIGYKILESYAKQFSTTEEAIRDMLASSDYYDIFEQSKYAEKFN